MDPTWGEMTAPNTFIGHMFHMSILWGWFAYHFRTLLAANPQGNAEEAAPQPSSAEAAGAAREPEAAPAPAPAAVPALAPPAPAPAAPVSPMASPRPMASSGPAQPPGAVFAVDDDALVQEWWRVRYRSLRRCRCSLCQRGETDAEGQCMCVRRRRCYPKV